VVVTLTVVCSIPCNGLSKVSDKNHMGLGPHKTGVISGFVFSSDQVCSQDYLVTGSMVGTYFSHGFGLYLCLFGVYPRLQWFPKLYCMIVL